MRVSDDRYTRDRQQFDLALRLIRHEARTFTIRQWTGLSDDRIRKLYRSYVHEPDAREVSRHRGKSPRQAAFFFRNPELNFQAAQLASLYVMYGLVGRQRCAGSSRAIASDRWSRAHCYAAPTRPIWKCTRRRAFPSSTRGFCCWRWRGTMRSASRAATCAAACGCAICWRSASWPAAIAARGLGGRGGRRQVHAPC